jgi:hypothetical protein
VCRVFWRQLTPWVLLRLNSGCMLSIPWGWTNLLRPAIDDSASNDRSAVLLSAPALRDLLRFVSENKRSKGRCKTF